MRTNSREKDDITRNGERRATRELLITLYRRQQRMNEYNTNDLDTIHYT